MSVMWEEGSVFLPDLVPKILLHGPPPFFSAFFMCRLDVEHPVEDAGNLSDGGVPRGQETGSPSNSTE